MSKVSKCVWIACLTIWPAVAAAQEPGALSNLFRRDPGGDVTVTVNAPTTRIPKPVRVNNGTVVTVAGSKSPISACTVATKREELKPEPNPIGQFLKLLAGAAPIPSALADDECPAPAGVPVPDDDEARRIEAALANIRANLNQSHTEVTQARTQHEATATTVNRFTNCRGADGVANICADAATFDMRKTEVRSEVVGRLNSPLPVVESVALQIDSLKKVLAERYKAPRAGEETWLAGVNSRLDCFAKHVAALSQSLAALKTVRAELETFSKLLDDHQTSLTYSKVLPEDNDAKVSGTVTCTNFFTKQVAVEAIPFTVTYQNIPRASVTAGVLFSTLDKRVVGTQAERTGTAADGTPTFRTAFADTDRSSNQLVPFSFFNVYLSGTRRMNLNLTGGVGVNPNNGKNQAEFFLGGAVGFNNVYIQFGGHIGRWQELGGGFRLGETVPDEFPGVPIERRYTMRPAIGLSYRIPLP
jgi:hypothetical protein